MVTLFPKIMYVPAERNFVSSVRNVSSLRGLPSTLYSFSDEFIDAIEELSGPLVLPINNIRFEYQKLNKLPWLVEDDYKIRLAESSSGLQSVVPLYLVTKHIADSVQKQGRSGVKEISIEEEKRIKKEIQDILANPALSEEVKKASLEVLSSKFRYSSFINIVEEPEQNLFPSSQESVLHELIRYAKSEPGNRLLITTHSPYLLSFLTLAIKAGMLAERVTRAGCSDGFLARLKRIVPETAFILPGEVKIYEFDAKGRITELGDYDGLPSDENYLNKKLSETNAIFSDLLELEDSCR